MLQVQGIIMICVLFCHLLDENCVKTHDPDALASFERLTSDNPSTSNRTQRFARLSDSVKLATIEQYGN